MTTLRISGRLINIPGFKLEKGKLKPEPVKNPSKRLRIIKSKKQKPVRRTV